MDYGDIYNIPEEDNSTDLLVMNKSFGTNDYLLKEVKRIANELIY